MIQEEVSVVPVVPMCRRGCANLTQQREERSWMVSGKEKTGREFGFQVVLTAFTQPIKRQLGSPFMRKRLRIVGSIVARGNMPKCARDRSKATACCVRRPGGLVGFPQAGRCWSQSPVWRLSHPTGGGF